MTNFPEWGTYSRVRVAFASATALAAVAGVSVALAGQAEISTVAGTGVEGGTGDGAAATLARLHEPGDVAMLPGGGFLIADTKNHRIREVAANGTISTAAGTGDNDFEGDGGPADEADLDKPGGVAPLPAGGFLIADTENDLIREVAPNGTIDSVAGEGDDGDDSDGDDDGGLELNKPRAVAPLPGGDFLIADTGNHVIRKVNSLGVSSVVAGTGSGGYSGDGGLATMAKLDAPYDVAALPAGGFLFSDHDKNVVRKVDSLGIITTVAGGGASGAEGVPATSAELDGPSGLAPISSGGFLVVSEHEHRVRTVSADGIIQTVAGTGNAGFMGDLGSPLDARFDSPLGITAGSMNGEILIADTQNDRVRAVSLGTSPNANTPAQPPANGGPAAKTPPPPPVLGKAVVVSADKGTVRLRRPGRKRFTVLTGSSRVPVGSIIDARRGKVALSSALSSAGKTQTAQFWAGVFQVRQARSGRGMTDIILRGAKPRCPAAGSRAKNAGISAKRKRKRGRRLWAKDDRGRFRTRGGHSVATTRGTKWLTTDTCAGTATRVFEGAVVVRNSHTGKKVTVRAGKRYLARPKR